MTRSRKWSRPDRPGRSSGVTGKSAGGSVIPTAADRFDTVAPAPLQHFPGVHMTNLHTSQIAALRAAIAGRVLQAEDDGYEQARQIWNAMIDRRPALIVQCKVTDDIALALRFARQHGLEVAVRGGGHNIAGHSISDGGLTIDLSGMRAVEVS